MKKNIGSKAILGIRKGVLSKAHGKILEIGIGTGTNLPLYPSEVKRITAVDSYIRNVPSSLIKVDLINESACKMSFPENTFDTVVSTFALCSIDDLEISLNEIYRVLKPGGQFLFLEHGKSKNKYVSYIQNTFNPLYNIFAYGCNINRSYVNEIEKSGFVIEESVYEKAPIYPRILEGYIYRGVARKF
ncbi:Methyltransferase domain-containing protein [Clostridium collagenovorans DSM 3089]|uniref:Methyltransferase domain-containing protein n=1 Tax=Clostridium collagenovorans DSM 3089 TaxID=1121306 RepID=A0A1M5SFT8_9CLOT|nr:class I SAM-dependent methyltransferase [Clostridium collagenovorans]SHH37351.1 Methyltransferase domain-containing protein [Clostridium collagenovorans DSM 3089]